MIIDFRAGGGDSGDRGEAGRGQLCQFLALAIDFRELTLALGVDFRAGGGDSGERAEAGRRQLCRAPRGEERIEREFVIDNLLVRILLIIEMILVDRPCAMGV